MRTKRILSGAGLLLTLTTGLVWASAPAKTAAQIKQAIISRSIADYWGSCPCETSCVATFTVGAQTGGSVMAAPRGERFSRRLKRWASA